MKKLLFSILVMILIVPAFVSAVDNRFFDNQTFDDADWCTASDWVIGGCDCDSGFLDCNEGQAAYYSSAIPEASAATIVTCEANLKQNTGQGGLGFFIWQFDDEDGLGRTDYTAIMADGDTFQGEDDIGGTEQQDISGIVGAPFAKLNVKETFWPNGSISLFINTTEVGQLTTRPDALSDVTFFQIQRILSRGEDTELDDFVCYNGTSYNVSEILPPGIKIFTITANDTYNGTQLKNITIRISNSSFSFNTSTVNGTILISNASIPSFNNTYQIDFRVNDSGGYFNKTFFNINITNTGSLEGDLFQSVLKLIAIDGLNNQTISTFSASTNQSFDSTTNGQILILIKEGTFQLNVTALGFEKLVTNFSINALANNSLNVSMGSIFTFRLVREETNNPFNFNLTNSTDLTIFCPNETIRITFNMSNNISQIVNCQFELMQITVDYGILGSYFRTLIPPFSQKNITWYLIDLLAGDTAIQKVIRLVDLTGDFSDATLRIKRAIPGETILKTMIEQKFDISSEVNLFLVKDALYTINIENDVEDIALGNLIPTEAGTQTITLPKIDFVPQETILGDDVSWSYTFNITLGILRLQYVDITNLTTFVRFIVKNGSDPNLGLLFQAESNNNATVTMTFNQVIANNTYVSELFFIHPGLSNFTETRPWYEFGGNFGALNLEGWSSSEQITFKNWAAWIFLFVWGMLWSRRYIGLGMTTLVIWMWIFKTLNWIEVNNLVFGFVALLAVVGWIVEAMKKE